MLFHLQKRSVKAVDKSYRSGVIEFRSWWKSVVVSQPAATTRRWRIEFSMTAHGGYFWHGNW